MCTTIPLRCLRRCRCPTLIQSGRHQMYPVMNANVAPHSVNSNSLERLNGAQCASMYTLDSTGVTTGDGNDTHDLSAALRLPF
jgi:hypothetical protein